MLYFHSVSKFVFFPSENLVTKFVRTFSQVIALAMLFSYHLAAGPRSKEDNSTFFLKAFFASSSGSRGVSPMAKLIYRSISWIKDSASLSGFVPESLSMARSG